jgi:hypothetical protein
VLFYLLYFSASKSLERSQGKKEKRKKKVIYFASTAHFAFPLFDTVSIDSLFSSAGKDPLTFPNRAKSTNPTTK